MMNFRILTLVLLGAFAAAALTLSSTANATGAPPTPVMPSDWTITSDIDFAYDDVRSVGANLSALRNTTYDVGGKKGQAQHPRRSDLRRRQFDHARVREDEAQRMVSASRVGNLRVRRS